MAGARIKPTFDDYLRALEASDVPLEWIGGEIYARDSQFLDMAGGSTVHARLTMSLAAALERAFADLPCVPMEPDQAIWVDEDTTYFPDVSVACPPLEHAERPRHALKNPVLVGEVRSPSTADWDLDGKFRGYRGLASLRHYVVVAQTHQEVKHFARQEDGSWRLTVHGPGESLHLRDHDVRVPVDVICARVELVGGPGPDTPAPGPRRAPMGERELSR